MQGYNCQLAVDSANQIIVAHAALNEHCDTQQLPAMICQIKTNTGRQARELSADAGYLSEANLRELKRRHIRGYRSFLLRGLNKVRLEWGLVCTAHNLAKLTARR